MTVRLAIVVLSFCAASVVSGVLLATATWGLPAMGLALGPWSVLLALVGGFLSVFWLVRASVLPPHLASPAWKAVVTLAGWIALTLVIWQGAMSVVRPVMRSTNFERGTFVLLILCLLGSLFVIELVVRRHGS